MIIDPFTCDPDGKVSVGYDTPSVSVTLQEMGKIFWRSDRHLRLRGHPNPVRLRRALQRWADRVCARHGVIGSNVHIAVASGRPQPTRACARVEEQDYLHRGRQWFVSWWAVPKEIGTALDRDELDRLARLETVRLVCGRVER